MYKAKEWTFYKNSFYKYVKCRFEKKDLENHLVDSAGTQNTSSFIAVSSNKQNM